MIPFYDNNISSAGGAVFNYIGGDVGEINQGGWLSGSSSQLYSDYIARIDARTVSENHSVFKVSNSTGNYKRNNAAPGEIVPDTIYTMMGENNGIFGYNLHDAESAYEITQDTAQELSLSINYQNCTLSGCSAAGTDVVFDKNGYVSVESENARFGISMVYNDQYPTDWFSIAVSGENTCRVSMEMTDAGYVLTADNFSDVYVYANNRQTSAEVQFSADAPRVLLYEIDEQTIGVAVDQDNDGSYETTVAQSAKVSAALGDANGDGVINANDATAVLAAAARLGTGGTTGFTEEQAACADVNSDGTINAMDATIILRYAAAVGTGDAREITGYI